MLGSPVELLNQSLAFAPTDDPASDASVVSSAVPARWAVYLFADADDRPIQLLCVRNLRASLKRRLGGGEVAPESGGLAGAGVASRRVDYRQIVRRVAWRRVDSAFEADLVYLEAARRCFPRDYAKLAGLRPAWFVHVDPSADLPRYVKTCDPTVPGGELFGPLPDKSAASRLVEQMEDLFDLCRYHDILAKAPRGRACAYKEMGRCPAPCDGSVSMEQYRRQVAYSMGALSDPADFVRHHEARMRQAATDLKFESAARIKAYVEALRSLFGKGDFAHVRPIGDLRLLSVQRGATARSAKLFLITPSVVEPLEALESAPDSASPVLRQALARADAASPRPSDINAVERLGVVAHHLFLPKRQGIYLPLDQLDDRRLAAAYAELRRQRQPEEPPVDGDEGVMKELQGQPEARGAAGW